MMAVFRKIFSLFRRKKDPYGALIKASQISKKMTEKSIKRRKCSSSGVSKEGSS